MNPMDPGFSRYMAGPIGGAFMEALNDKKFIMTELIKAGLI